MSQKRRLNQSRFKYLYYLIIKVYINHKRMSSLVRWTDPSTDIWGGGDLISDVFNTSPSLRAMVPIMNQNLARVTNRVTQPLAPILKMDMVEKPNEFIVQADLPGNI